MSNNEFDAVRRVVKESFSVIGLEGSTGDGPDFVQKLWAEANSRFNEVAPLAKRDGSGNLAGIWGLMTDMSRSFLPWEDGFSRGLYLAGVECADGAEPPSGWTKWTIPGFEYAVMDGGPGAFEKAIARLGECGLTLCGAVQDFTDPAEGREYMYFPVRKLD